jgi:GT2 family glycosyltransferase
VPEPNPLVSIALLTYNSADLIDATLDAIDAQTYPNIELHVLDNDSADETTQRLRERGVDFDVSPRNVGFVRGMNALFERASGDYVIFLNADCVLSRDFVARAVETAIHSEADVVGAHVSRATSASCIDPDRPAPLDGGRLGIGIDMRVRHVQVEPGGLPQPAFKANGACPFVSTALLTRLGERFAHGPFAPIFDTYGEDIDFCFRAAAVGARTVYDPGLAASHVRSASSGAVSVRDKRGPMRVNIVSARHLNVHRHHSPTLRILSVPLLWLQDAAICGLQSLSGDWSIWRDVLEAHRQLHERRAEVRSFRRQHKTWRAWSVREARVGARIDRERSGN